MPRRVDSYSEFLKENLVENSAQGQAGPDVLGQKNERVAVRLSPDSIAVVYPVEDGQVKTEFYDKSYEIKATEELVATLVQRYQPAKMVVKAIEIKQAVEASQTAKSKRKRATKHH